MLEMITHMLKAAVIVVGLILINKGIRIKDGGIQQILCRGYLSFTRDRLLPWLLATSFLIQILLLSYPIYFSEGGLRLIDLMWQNPLLKYQSSLFHYPGAPFLFSFIQSHFVEDPLILLSSLKEVQDSGKLLYWIVAWINICMVLLVQKLLFLCIVFFVYKIMLHVTNRFYAFLAALLFGTNVGIAIWAQTFMSAFLLSGMLMFYCFQFTRKSSDVNWVILGIVSGLMVLVRPNSLLVVPLAALFINWGNGRNMKNAVIYLVIAATVYALFIGLVHRPSTGTWALSYNAGPNLWMRLNRIGIRPESHYGPFSAEILEYSLREPSLILTMEHFKRKYQPDKILKPQDYELAETPHLGIFTMLSFLGFERGSRTMMMASVEAIRQNPWVYIKSIGHYFLASTVDIRRRSLAKLPNIRQLKFRGENNFGFQKGIVLKGYKLDSLVDKTQLLNPRLYFLPGIYFVTSLTWLTILFSPMFLFIGMGLSFLFIFVRRKENTIIRRLVAVTVAYLVPTLAIAGVMDGRYVYPIIPVMYIVSATLFFIIGKWLFKLIVWKKRK